MCPAYYPGARGPVDHRGHADQLLLDPRLHQQLLGLDWTVQGDVTGKTGSPSATASGLSILRAHRSWAQTEELTLTHPRVLAHLGTGSEREGAYSMMARPRNETVLRTCRRS